MARTNAQILKGSNPLYFKSFKEYTPRAVFVENTSRDGGEGRSYAWPMTSSDEKELKDFDEKASWVQWQPALASEGSCIILSEAFLMTRERAQAEAEEICKNLKKAAPNW